MLLCTMRWSPPSTIKRPISGLGRTLSIWRSTPRCRRRRARLIRQTHAAVAGAASEVLAYVFPDKAQKFRAMSEEAGRSRSIAGVAFPSDIAAGLALGHAIGAEAVKRGKADGFDAKWTGSVPTTAGSWTGTNPILPLAGTWRTWL